jgi:hypothetical protein
MAMTLRQTRSSNPLHRLSVGIRCDPPDVSHLTIEQQYALHEFFHTVLAAGYKLFQVVPAERAAPIIEKKFGLVIGLERDQDLDQ